MTALVCQPAVANQDSLAEVLDVSEAAALLRVTPSVVQSLADAERIPARRVGDTWRFAREALLEWLKGERFAGMAIVPPSAGNVPLPSALQTTDLAQLSAKGTSKNAAAPLAQASPAAKPEPASPAPPTVGERPTTRTADEIARRDQSLLLRGGAATVDVGAAFARSERSLFPVLRTEQNNVTATATARYGVRDDLQLTLRAPATWRRTVTYNDGTVTSQPPVIKTRDSFGGDASLSLLSVALREAMGRPNVIWSLDGVIPTGPGDRGLGAGVVLAKSFDPAVLFAGVSYLRGMSIDRADPRRALARNNVGLSFGYTYALNDALALNSALVATYRDTRSADDIAIPPPRESYQLQFGMTWMLARGLFMEPAIGVRVGADHPDFTFSLNVPYSF